ncbi:MAG: right-handed parallel beta-helix repeat-containing protein, partial [Thermoplasmata archaeon]|nr:right-handed parallel beta-helix repeat-containing protein [Thermoplasmata archaeon]
AIENASDGDTIIVGDGIYHENLIVNKSVSIVGESRNAVIDSSGDVINITAGEVNVSWLTIRNGSIGMLISGSTNVTISNCNISNNILGVELNSSSDNNICGNNISGNSDDGLWLLHSNNNTISKNVFIKNGDSNVGTGGLNIYSSEGNIIYHNNFMDNYIQAYVSGSILPNTWDNGYPSGGNYWSDFDEPSEGAQDNDSDGIVDSPYNISGVNNLDMHPLVKPFDLSPPYTTCTLNGTAGDNGWYVDNVTVTLSSADNDSAIYHTFYRIDNGSWIIYNGSFVIPSEGAHTLEYYSVDTVGNTESMKSTVIKIDKSLPSIDCYLQPETPDGNDGWYTGNVEVTLSADDSASGVASIKYHIDQDTWRDYTGYFLLTVEGNHTFTYYASDYAGYEITDSRDIKIDKTAPQVSVSSPSGGYVEGIVDIEWNASDNVDDDMDGDISIYAVSGGERTEIATGLDNDGTYQWNTMSLDDASYTIEVVATDDAGNNGTNSSQPFILDNSPPTINIDQPRGGEVLGSGKNLVIFWNASDDVDSNLDGTIWISYSHDGGSTWTDILEGVANSGKYTYGIDTWENGKYMLRINATDDAGNTGWAVSGNFTIDKTSPTVTIKRPESGYLYMNIAGREIIPPIPISLIPLPYNTIIIGKITVEISASDEFSDIDHIDIDAGGAKATLDGGSNYKFEWNTPLGKCDLSVVAYDMAGNSGEDELTDIFCINM